MCKYSDMPRLAGLDASGVLRHVLTLQLHKKRYLLQIKTLRNPMDKGYKEVAVRSLNHIQEVTANEVQQSTNSSKIPQNSDNPF